MPEPPKDEPPPDPVTGLAPADGEVPVPIGLPPAIEPNADPTVGTPVNPAGKPNREPGIGFATPTMPVPTRDVDGPISGIGWRPMVGEVGVPIVGVVGVPMVGDSGVPIVGVVGVPIVGNRGAPIVGFVGVPIVGDNDVPIVGDSDVPIVGLVGVPIVGVVGVPIVGRVGVPIAGTPIAGVPIAGEPAVPVEPTVGSVEAVLPSVGESAPTPGTKLVWSGSGEEAGLRASVEPVCAEFAGLCDGIVDCADTAHGDAASTAAPAAAHPVILFISPPLRSIDLPL